MSFILSRPSPVKKRTTRLSKDFTKLDVSVILDETVEQITEGAKTLESAMAAVNSNPSNVSTIVQLNPPLSPDRGIEILVTEEDLLRASNILPLPSSLQEELLHNNLLSEEDRLKLAEQGKKNLSISL